MSASLISRAPLTSTMTLREMNLRVFQRKPTPHVFFQPRFEPWFDWHQQFGTLPAYLKGGSMRDAYDRIGASIRYVDYYTNQPPPVPRGFPDVRQTVEERDNRRRVIFHTPHGDLFETFEMTIDKTWRKVEFLAKSPEDLKALRWILERQQSRYSPENFAKGNAYIGDRGCGAFYIPKSPYFAMAQEWMKYEDFIYALVDSQSEIEDIFKVIDESYDGLYQQLCAAPELTILNFGENVADAYVSRRYWEKYCIPWYEKRSGQLRAAGLFTHIHIDGYFRPLLPYLKSMPFDGYEALTPKPQGDVTLEEIRDAIGDKILLDGIPAVLFLRHQPFEQLKKCVDTLIDYFHPRLVLGISDELPEGEGEEAYVRMKWVSEYCRTRR